MERWSGAVVCLALLHLSVRIRPFLGTPAKEVCITLKEKIQTDRAPQAIGPYSQAIKAGGFIFASGQVALDPRTGQLMEGGIKEQTGQTIRNLAAVLEAAGSGLDHVVKTTVFLRDMNDFTAMNEVYATFFGAVVPARATVATAGLPKDARVEIEAIALAATEP